MSLKIRLSRGGAKKRPFYRIVVADARMPRDGRFVERIGTFDPLKAKDAADRLVVDAEKAKAWLAKGAQPTDRVARLLETVGVGHRAAQSTPEKAKPKKKAQERAPPPPLLKPPQPLLPPPSRRAPSKTIAPAPPHRGSWTAPVFPTARSTRWRKLHPPSLPFRRTILCLWGALARPMGCAVRCG